MVAEPVGGWRPRNAAEVERALRSYLDDRGRLESAGLYTAQDGSCIRSTRRGRPTEMAAVFLVQDAERVRVVESWLHSLERREKYLVRYYTECVSIRRLARAHKLPFETARRLTLRIPVNIWDRWYGIDSVGQSG